jgi:hypothetical protein
MKFGTRTHVALAATGALAATAGAVALATPPSGQTVTPLARGSLVNPAKINENVGSGRVKIQTQGAVDVLAAHQTLAPGGTSGWHKHPGPHITIVTQGTLTEIDAKCKRHDLAAGQADIDSGESIGKVENRASTPLVIYVTFLVPHGVIVPRIDEPAPAGCKA